MSLDAEDPSAFKAWLEQNGPIESIQAVVCDLNGIMRGKRVPVEQAAKVLGGGIRMPLSIVGVDVWGEDIIVDERMVDVHVSWLRSKLAEAGVAGTTIGTVYGAGYRFVPPGRAAPAAASAER